MDPLELIFVPLVVFISVVLPLWIIFHYITIWKREKRERAQVKGTYTDLETLATRIEERLEVVEHLLDQEDPGWRKS